MFYDLHMHSCLSPCADDEMTPNNICNMALIKGLELIAVTDHNSVRQQPAIDKVAKAVGIRVLYGCELESSEAVHCLGLFARLEDNQKLQPWIDSQMPGIPNKPDYYGKQQIMNEFDQEIGIEDQLLIVSLNASLDEVIDEIHRCGGKAVLAHVLDRKNSITHELGFIPEDLKYDGIEVKSEEQRQLVLKLHPWIKDEETVWFIDSDAHRLTDISEPDHWLRDSDFRKLWGDNV